MSWKDVCDVVLRKKLHKTMISMIPSLLKSKSQKNLEQYTPSANSDYFQWGWDGQGGKKGKSTFYTMHYLKREVYWNYG